MIRARKTSRWLLVLAFTMRLSSLCWLAVTSIGTGAGMIGTLPKALHYTISFMGHDTRYWRYCEGAASQIRIVYPQMSENAVTSISASQTAVSSIALLA